MQCALLIAWPPQEVSKVVSGCKATELANVHGIRRIGLAYSESIPSDKRCACTSRYDSHSAASYYRASRTNIWYWCRSIETSSFKWARESVVGPVQSIDQSCACGQ